MAMRRMRYRRRFPRRVYPKRRSTRSYGKSSLSRYRRRGKFDRYAATSNINRGGDIFRNRKPNLQRYFRGLKEASNASPHYRSVNSIPFSTPSAAVIQQGVVTTVAMVPDAGGGLRFWEAAGGLVRQDNLPATTDFGGGDLFVRGGKANLTYTNNTVVNLKVKIWKAKSTRNGTFIASPSVAVSDSWDPSLPTDLLGAQDTWRLYRAYWNTTYLLKPGESIDIVHFLKPQKIDQDSWINLRSRDMWMIYVQNVASNVAVSVSTVVASWNLSFSADRIT